MSSHVNTFLMRRVAPRFLGFGTKSVMATTKFVMLPLEGNTNSVMNGTKSVMT
jgi:hypothetical protein